VYNAAAFAKRLDYRSETVANQHKEGVCKSHAPLCESYWHLQV